MKTFKLAMLISCAGLFISGCEGGGKPDLPDLVVTSLETEGEPFINPLNSVQQRIRAVVRNQGEGNAAAGIFKIAIHYTSRLGTFVVAFDPDPAADVNPYYGWYAFTRSPLSVGEEVIFTGTLTFHSAVHSETVSLKAIADSCDGDEFMPEHCRVEESNEGNNESASISVTLP